MSVATMRELLEAGVHFGHYTRRWHPKMRRFIFTERNGIHIIDLAKTVTALDRAGEAISETVSQGGVVLFVGTKKQAMDTVRQAAERVNMPYVIYRWLGGMLTNWDTMRQRVKHLLDLEARRDRGEFSMLPKKEALLLDREIAKLNLRLGGIKAMTDLPDLLFIVDTHRESIALAEANKLKIPVIGMVDTNADPDLVQFPIPANDDAIRSIKLITEKVADCVQEGMALRESAFVEEMTASEAEMVDTSQRVFDPFEEERAAEEAGEADETADGDDEAGDEGDGGEDGDGAEEGESGAKAAAREPVTNGADDGGDDVATESPDADESPSSSGEDSDDDQPDAPEAAGDAHEPTASDEDAADAQTAAASEE